MARRMNYGRTRQRQRTTRRRAAYKKNAKKAFMIKRAPLVETKKCELQDIVGDEIGDFEIPETLGFKQVVNDTNVHYFVPYNYYSMTQGTAQHQMLGNDIFCKYLNMKIAIRFPQGANTNTNNHYELYWGWVKNSPCPNGLTNPKLGQYNANIVNAHVIAMTGPFFNAKGDRLKWRPKDDKNLKIIGKKKVRPDLRYSTVAPLTNSGAPPTDGNLPDYETQVSWKPMRKIKYELGNITGTPAYCLTQEWIPFCCLYMPFNVDGSASDPSSTQQVPPKVGYNTIMYFTDS